MILSWSWLLPFLLVFFSTLSFSHPVSTGAWESTEAWDVVVIGGGPAGLSATSGLARVRRNVLMLDSGEYRNGPTRHMHDVIGNDGKHLFCCHLVECG
jgi:heterodisulfide reductase subunit A-like polyferredoxin